MARDIFSIKDEDLEVIQNKMREYQGDTEEVINNFLMNEASKIFTDSIINYIPLSNRNKKHAKLSNPLMHTQKYNLELIIKTKSKFNYLYFPQNAEGTSKGKQPNDFMEKGIDAEYDNVINRLIEKLQNNNL